MHWGDLVDIPDAPHKLNAAWEGFPESLANRLARCLSRTINLTVNTNSKMVELAPKLQPTRNRVVPGPRNDREPGVLFASLPFRLWQVLTESGMLISSSDLEHVRVRREDPETGQNREWVLDVRNEQSPGANFWVRNGDQIQVRDAVETGKDTGQAAKG